jgi:hypothetical protein
MVSSLQQYKSSLLWFITGLALAFLISFSISGNIVPQTSIPSYHSSPVTEYPVSDFAATHQEPNFY